MLLSPRPVGVFRVRCASLPSDWQWNLTYPSWIHVRVHPDTTRIPPYEDNVGLFVIVLACPKVVRLIRSYLRFRTVV
jgi:hypothetical protein